MKSLKMTKSNSPNYGSFAIIIVLIFSSLALGFSIVHITSPISLILVVLLMMILVISAIEPIYGLAIIVVSITLLGGRALVSVGDYWFLASEAATCAVAAGWLLNANISHKEKPSFNGILKYYMIFILLNIPAMIKGYEVGNSLGYILFDVSLHVRYVLVGIIAYNIISNRGTLKKILSLFVICGTLMCLFALYSYYFGATSDITSTEMYYGGYGRVGSTFGNPNSFAGFLEFFIPIVLALLFYAKRLSIRFLLLISICFGIWALLLSFSRGGFAAILISISIMIAISPMKASYKIVPLTVFTLLLITIFMIPALTRQADIFTGKTLEQELVYGPRGEQYGDYFEYISESPISGNGWGLEQVGYSFFPKQTGVFVISGLNSYMINLLVKGGILAFIGFVLLTYEVLKKLIISMNTTVKEIEYFLILGIIAGMAGFLVHLFFDNLLIWPMGGMNFWFLIGIGMLPAKESYVTD